MHQCDSSFLLKRKGLTADWNHALLPRTEVISPVARETIRQATKSHPEPPGAMFNPRDRGAFLPGPGTGVLVGMLVGALTREINPEVNVVKRDRLINLGASGKD